MFSLAVKRAMAGPRRGQRLSNMLVCTQKRSGVAEQQMPLFLHLLLCQSLNADSN